MEAENSASVSGCTCQEPDRHAQATINQVLMGLPVLVATYALARHRARKLLVYLPAVAAFLTVWRRWVCARCTYYGKECSTLLGVMTARMMPRDETRELDRNTMIVDFAFMGAIMALPLRQVLRRPLTALAYAVTSALAVGSILLRSCDSCENEFCPMKDLREAVVRK